jgi:hypothetical protein
LRDRDEIAGVPSSAVSYPSRDTAFTELEMTHRLGERGVDDRILNYDVSHKWRMLYAEAASGEAPRKTLFDLHRCH